MMLITGVSRGLGKFLHRHFQADAWRRGDDIPDKHYEKIVHCAHDHKNPYQNLEMLNRLFTIPCEKFIYISSVDVFNGLKLAQPYAHAKMQCEAWIRQHYSEYLIIRPCALLGDKPSAVTRMVDGEELRTSEKSTYGYIRYASLIPFIENGDDGTITISGNIMKLGDIAEQLELKPKFGGFTYLTPPVKSTHDTMEEIREYLNDRDNLTADTTAA